MVMGPIWQNANQVKPFDQVRFTYLQYREEEKTKQAIFDLQIAKLQKRFTQEANRYWATLGIENQSREKKLANSGFM
jgi:hypothetical protein